MTHDKMYNIKYPAGEYDYQRAVSKKDVQVWIREITEFPSRLSGVVTRLSREQLNTPYRTGGWKVNQVVHHLCDSHLNGYLRFKLVLTEDLPTIKTYDQHRWAALKEYELLPVEDSLKFLELAHKRWGTLLKTMDDKTLNRKFIHPESGTLDLKIYLGAYAWHGRHHLAQITSLMQRMGW